MINATICYLRRGDETLFLHRNKGEGDIHNGLYVPPGGRLERGEKGIDCVIREFKEETGLRLLDPRLRIIATFYNEGRLLGNKLSSEDWSVEIYEATSCDGELRAESSKANPVWVPEKRISHIKMHEGDRRIMELLRLSRGQDGVFQVLTQYKGEKLVRFESTQVA